MPCLPEQIACNEEESIYVAAVALANKTARMAWAMLRNETNYDPDFAIR